VLSAESAQSDQSFMVQESASMAGANESQLLANKKTHNVSRIVEMSDSDSVASLNEDPNEKANSLIKVSISPKNKE